MREKNNSPKKVYVNLHHARTKEQITVMSKIVLDGVCPFCPENIKKYHSKPIIKNGKRWILTENMSPYEGTKYHFLLISKRHFTMPGDINSEEAADLFKIISWLTSKYKISGGTIILRFGNPDMTGATVDHLHFHVVVGNSSRQDPGAIGIKKKIGYMKK